MHELRRRGSLFILCGALLGAGIAAQEPSESSHSEARPVAEILDDLTTTLKTADEENDRVAVSLLQQLVAACDGEVSKGDLKKIRVAAGSALNKTRPRPPERLDYYAAATDVLSRLGRDGARELIRAYEDTKRYPKYDEPWLTIRAGFLVGAGKTGDSSAIDFLCRVVKKTDEDRILVACADALRPFADAKPGHRKEIVKVMIRRYADLEVSANAIPPLDRSRRLQDDVQRFKKTLAAVRDPWNRTLAELTGATHAKAADWDEWWRDHKNKKWQ